MTRRAWKHLIASAHLHERAQRDMERDVTASAGASDDQALAAAEQRAATQWQQLGMRMRAITPSGLMRFLLVTGAIGGVGWLAVASWPALLPFVIGASLAYIILPIVNALDRVMPRLFAAAITTVAVLAALVLIVLILVRPIVLELIQLYRAAQGVGSANALASRLDHYLRGLPQPVHDFVRTGLQQSIATAQTQIRTSLSGIQNLGFGAVLGVVNTIGTVLGLLVLPIWLLLVLRDQRRAVGTLNRHLPRWMGGDFWAGVRILDRAFGVYVRGLMVQGIVTGLLTYLGLLFLHRLGSPQLPFPLALAVLAGLLKLIPTLGPIFNFAVGALVGLAFSPQTALAILAVYAVVSLLVNRFVGSRVQNKVINIHPVVLASVIVALSQFGLLWALLAAPITAVARDLYRYVYGRFGEPPRPAGLLPGEPLRVSSQRTRRQRTRRAPSTPTHATHATRATRATRATIASSSSQNSSSAVA